MGTHRGRRDSPLQRQRCGSSDSPVARAGVGAGEVVQRTRGPTIAIRLGMSTLRERRGWVLVAVIAASLGASPTVLAQAVQPGPEQGAQTTALYGVLGLGTPLGVLGLEGVHRLGNRFELSVGFGEGYFLGAGAKWTGIQWTAMPRLRLGNAGTLGAGLSGGNWAGEISWFGPGNDCIGSPCPSPSVHYVVWGNLEVGSEHWLRAGLAVRFFAGLSQALTGATFPIPIPYLGVGIGYAF